VRLVAASYYFVDSFFKTPIQLHELILQWLLCGHDISAVFLPLLKATSSGDSIERNALMVALTTLTGFVDP
jgi:hypothetical protein